MHKWIASYFLVSAFLPAALLAQTCSGDCNADGRVTTEELVLITEIASGEVDEGLCRNADVNGNGAVTPHEQTAAADSALFGCPYAPRPRPAANPECPDGFLVGELSKLENSNVTPTPLELKRAQGRIRSITFPGGDPGFELTGTFPTCPPMTLSRTVILAVRTRHELLPGDYFIDGTDVRFAYAEAQGGMGGFVRGWTANDGVLVLDAVEETSVVFHVVGATMAPDTQSGPTGTFIILANGAVDQLTP